MPTYTGRQIITSALRFAHVIDPIDAPEAEHLKVGEELAVDLLDAWRNERLTIPATTRLVKAMTANTASYTIGEGGSINTTWPSSIPYWGLIQDNAAAQVLERPMGRLLTDAEYAGVRMKTRTGSPTALWYDRQFAAGLGRVYPLPYPEATGQSLVLYIDIGDLTTLDKDVAYNLRPGVARALKTALGVELGDEYGSEVTDAQRQRAKSALANVKRANDRPRVAAVRSDFAMLGHGRRRRRFNVRMGG